MRPDCLKFQSECPDIWIRLPRHRWPKSWDKIEDPVVLLERNLCGHPLAGLLREGQFKEASHVMNGVDSTPDPTHTHTHIFIVEHVTLYSCALRVAQDVLGWQESGSSFCAHFLLFPGCRCWTFLTIHSFPQVPSSPTGPLSGPSASTTSMGRSFRENPFEHTRWNRMSGRMANPAPTTNGTIFLVRLISWISRYSLAATSFKQNAKCHVTKRESTSGEGWPMAKPRPMNLVMAKPRPMIWCRATSWVRGKFLRKTWAIPTTWGMPKRNKAEWNNALLTRRRKDFHVGSEIWNDVTFTGQNSLDTRSPKRAVHWSQSRQGHWWVGPSGKKHEGRPPMHSAHNVQKATRTNELATG